MRLHLPCVIKASLMMSKQPGYLSKTQIRMKLIDTATPKRKKKIKKKRGSERQKVTRDSMVDKE